MTVSTKLCQLKTPSASASGREISAMSSKSGATTSETT